MVGVMILRRNYFEVDKLEIEFNKIIEENIG